MHSLQDFISFLEYKSQIVRVKEEISTCLELTEVQRKIIKKGPAVIFENLNTDNMMPYKSHTNSSIYPKIPIICNLFGTQYRVALGLGLEITTDLRQLGKELSMLKQMQMPKNWSEIKNIYPTLRRILSMKSIIIKSAQCQERVFLDDQVNIGALPIQTCWHKEPAPLITWGICVTKDENDFFNLGVYRMQVLSYNKIIVRWLKHRGGAEHYREWKQKQHTKMPISVIIGADPATLLAAVMPIPENISEYDFSGLIRKSRLQLVKCKTNDILVPANSEIILEGYIDLNEMSNEGPYGDHTGFYNEIEKFPVMTITAITMKSNPIYLTTFTGRPPDEPSVLGEALNEVFIPLLQTQFTEIVDFWLPPEACSYRIAIVSIKKSYPGHAKRIMMGIWSYLKQFSYTKFIIVVDEDINIRSWPDVMWAVSTQMDFDRDVLQCKNTPIDYLDFASQQLELSTKMGFDATKKIFPETQNRWGKEIIFDEKLAKQTFEKLRNTELYQYYM